MIGMAYSEVIFLLEQYFYLYLDNGFSSKKKILFYSVHFFLGELKVDVHYFN